MVGWLAGLAVALFVPAIAVAIYVLVTAMWLIPDRRIERVLN